MKRILIVLTIIVSLLLSGCASWERFKKDVKSDWNEGLQRTITIYNANGDVLKTYKGKIDLEVSEGGYVKFDLNGKRIMYYNCYVEVLEE